MAGLGVRRPRPGGMTVTAEHAYGIGRVPGDVDPTEEAQAELEAEALQPTPAGYDMPWGARDGGTSNDTGPCRRCRQPGYWVPGAGQYLCWRHEDDY